MPNLRDEAIRMKRTKWRDRTDLLAQELFAIFASIDVPTTGPVTVDTGNGNPVTYDDPRLFQGTFGDLVLPDLNLPDFEDYLNPNGVELAEPDTADASPVRRRRQRRRVQYVREVFPGTVVSGTEDTYQVKVYPNGFTAATVPASSFLGSPASLPAGDATVEVKQLQIADGETIPAGTWALVWSVSVVLITTDEEVAGQATTTVGTRIAVIHTERWMQVSVWLAPAEE